MKYLTISELADKWDISVRRVQQLCKEGAIEGSFKEGKSWMIPEDSILEEKASYNVNRRAGHKDKNRSQSVCQVISRL